MRVMFPFLSGPSDLRQALELLEESAEALRRDGRAVGGDLPVGVNVEIPSAALTIDLLPAPVAFLSLGTNDLVQFTLAADRSDPRVAAHYQPLHPAVLRLVHEAAERAAARGLPLAACGEMAGHPLTALLLLGLGVQELSMRPPAIPRVKAAIRAARLDQAREVARACLALPTAEEIERVLRGELGNADSAGTEAVFSA
jgi:phosphotransferase system enzyme I (PtsI)